MRIIDAYIHTNFNKEELARLARINNIDFSLEGLEKEMKENHVVKAVSITDHFELETPMALEEIEQQSKNLSLIVPCVGINPYKITKNSFVRLEKVIIGKKVKAIKIFLGYYPFYANAALYHPFYRLAGKYRIPVIFHTGDTMLKTAKLKY